MPSLPPHPDDVVPQGTADCQPPPTAPTAARLGYARAALQSMRNSHATTRATAALDAGAELQEAEPFGWEVAGKVTTAASELLGWACAFDPGPWSKIAATLGITCRPGEPPAWTAACLRRALDVVAKDAGRGAAQFRAEVLAKLLADADVLAARIAERARAAALTLYADDAVVARVAKAEGHLSRELGRVLALLAHIQAVRKAQDAAAGDPGPKLWVCGGAAVQPRAIGFDLLNALPAAGRG